MFITGCIEQPIPMEETAEPDPVTTSDKETPNSDPEIPVSDPEIPAYTLVADKDEVKIQVGLKTTIKMTAQNPGANIQFRLLGEPDGFLIRRISGNIFDLDIEPTKDSQVGVYSFKGELQSSRGTIAVDLKVEVIPKPVILTAKAPIIKAVSKIGSNYVLVFEKAESMLDPAGGYDTVINSDDKNDNASYSGFSRTFTGLNESIQQCFILEARYTQLEPSQFLRSNQVCVDGQAPPSPPIDYSEIKAFPTAQGYGRYATGGRGGIVYHVTNLNDKGTGSLRYGMESIKGPRTIVFDVSGYIDIETPLKIRQGYSDITIAGETAPAGGVTIRGASVWINDGNVIVRHIRIRPGKEAWNPANLPPDHPDYEPDDGFRIYAFANTHIKDVILDHVSISWGSDGLLDVGANNNGASARDITIQNCLIAENVDKHYGSLITAYNVSWYRNITAYTGDRNIAISSLHEGGVEMVNNFLFNTQWATWYRGGLKVDFIGNVFDSGNTDRKYDTFKMEGVDTSTDLDIANSYVYMRDNTDNGAKADNNYNGRAAPYIKNLPYHKTGLPIIDNSEVEESLLGSVGSTINQDAVDERLFNQIRNRTGNLITHENQVGGYPSITSTRRPSNYDTDNDGMADSWELKTYGSLSKSNSGDENNNGYTNLEEFLHSIAP